MEENLPMRIIHFDSMDLTTLINGIESSLNENMVHYAPPHWHRSIELVYVVKGGLRLRLGNESLEYHTGEFLFVNSADVHEVSNLPGLHTEVICFIISYDYLKLLQPGFDKLRFDISLNRDVNKYFKVGFERIMELFSDVRKTVYQHLLIRSELDKILYYLFNYCEDKETNIEFREMIYEMREYTQVLQFIHDNYTSGLTLEVVASHFNFSREYFSRRFGEVFGKSFLRYLVDYRIRQAFDDVIYTKDLFDVISKRHGFPSPRAFATQFKDHYGCSPQDYRRKYIVSIITEDDIRKMN